MEDKGKKVSHAQSELMGVKPFGNIGPGGASNETKSVVGKLKKKKVDSLVADGSTSQSGEKANVGEVSCAINSFVNRK